MLKRTLEDYKVLLRSIPSANVTLFVGFHGWRLIAASP